ncbi:hypothetical protein EmuJ_000052400 [Echinococcus multilocularis]|uniref:Uncharacterized protein n=1 Tax=Echinococcus multilocularis TaxID=6211 RepID=A0A087VX97_ECHMU|nr:hypothetical protein EmuJ_000052400 [Echinococcus multilocularis]
MFEARRLLVFIAILHTVILPIIQFASSAPLLLRFILAVCALLILHHLSLLRSKHIERPKHREQMEYTAIKVRPELLPPPSTVCVISLILVPTHLVSPPNMFLRGKTVYILGPSRRLTVRPNLASQKRSTRYLASLPAQ